MDTLYLIMSWLAFELIIPVMAWCNDAIKQFLDPLWIVTIVGGGLVGLLGFIVGLLQISVNRNIRTMDDDIRELKQEIVKLRDIELKELKTKDDSILDKAHNLETMLASLQTSHDNRMCLLDKNYKRGGIP